MHIYHLNPCRRETEPCTPVYCCICCPPVAGATFTLTKADRLNDAPLANAVYGIYQNGKLIQSATSGADGALSFCNVPQGTYALRELRAPAGYRLEGGDYTLTVSENGAAAINGQAANGYRLYDVRLSQLSFTKRDTVTGAALPGASFRLSNGTTAVSDGSGQVNLGTLAPGTYTLEETQPPAGYLAAARSYTVTVDDAGALTINGVPLSLFTVGNTPYPSLSFRKYNAATGQPLPGASFRLSNGVTATSDSSGLVSLGSLAPGSYTMQETSAPSGFPLPGTIYQVTVNNTGEITVDGIPLSDFAVSNTPEPAPSPAPVIDAILPGAVAVTGTGVPGASVTAAFPDGSSSTTIVTNNDIWVAAVPNGVNLAANQVVSATQTVPGFSVSPSAIRVVQQQA